MTKFWKTMVTVEILSDGDEPPAFGSLEQVQYAITFGDCSGEVSTSTEELTGPEMAQALVRQGSDPRFLGLDPTGNEVGY
jgi:hypothetical protein